MCSSRRLSGRSLPVSSFSSLSSLFLIESDIRFYPRSHLCIFLVNLFSTWPVKTGSKSLGMVGDGVTSCLPAAAANPHLPGGKLVDRSCMISCRRYVSCFEPYSSQSHQYLNIVPENGTDFPGHNGSYGKRKLLGKRAYVLQDLKTIEALVQRCVDHLPFWQTSVLVFRQGARFGHISSTFHQKACPRKSLQTFAR